MDFKRGPPVGKSRSPSADSNRSAHSNASDESNRSRSRSRSGSRSSSPSRSRSVSGSRASLRSNWSQSDSADSVDRKSGHSGSRSRSRSGSRSAHSNSGGSRSASAASGSARSRSHSRSRSRSHSCSRSNSEGGRMSATSNLSARSIRSVSKTPSYRSGSRSRSGSEKSRSRSHTPQADLCSGNEEEQKEGAVDAADLFGDVDDISSDEDEEKAKETRGKTHISDLDDDYHPMEQEAERERTSGDERNVHQEENKKAEVKVSETRIDVELPKITCDLGKEIHLVKLPNFLSVEPRLFNPKTYEDEIDEEGRARLKLKVENAIRWRQEINNDGDVVNQSNARLVRWSDGSLSLHLGSEIFDVQKQQIQGDHNHLHVRQGTGLQGQAVFPTKLSFRPHSTESFTHRKMTMSLADRSQKTSGIKILSQVGIDPDQDRKSMLKKEEEKLKQTFTESKPRRCGVGCRSHACQAYCEEYGSEDEGAISLNAIKNEYKSGGNLHCKGGKIYSSDEEGSDFEARYSKKLDKPKALKDSESSADTE